MTLINCRPGALAACASGLVTALEVLAEPLPPLPGKAPDGEFKLAFAGKPAWSAPPTLAGPWLGCALLPPDPDSLSPPSLVCAGAHDTYLLSLTAGSAGTPTVVRVCPGQESGKTRERVLEAFACGICALTPGQSARVCVYATLEKLIVLVNVDGPPEPRHSPRPANADPELWRACRVHAAGDEASEVKSVVLASLTITVLRRVFVGWKIRVVANAWPR
jgi:hypothetical protein